MQRLDAEHLRSEAAKAPLRALLGGVPITKRRKKAASRALLGLHAHCWALHDALGRDLRVQGDTTGQSEQATLELRRGVCERGEATLLAHCSKRALLLLGIWLLPAARQHFLDSPTDAPLARELLDRVLPLTAPTYMRHGGAQPVEFCMDVEVMLRMWAGERFWTGEQPTANSLSAV